jgi:hypothetical protein
MSLARTLPAAVALAALLGAAPSARCASHLWVVNEVFSNEDGSIQFIEMHVPSSAADETQITNRWLRSNATAQQYNFSQNLPPGSTAFAYMLLATQSFAGLPGAPAPDHIIPANFFSVTSDSLRYWLYVTGDLGISPGEVPLDGLSSLQRDGSTPVNSPTNFNGETGSIDLTTVAAPMVQPPPVGPITSFRVLSSEPRGSTFTIEFELRAAAAARVDLVDVSGRTVRSVFDGSASGVVRRTWSADEPGESVAAGVYFVRLITADASAARKVAVVR